MPIIFVPSTVKETIPKEPFCRELYWYDPIQEQMKIFHGGQLTFTYTEDEFLVAMGPEERAKRGINSTSRLLPKVEDLYVKNYSHPITISNIHRISEWFDQYLNYQNSDASISSQEENGVEFSVPQEEMDDFIYDLERHGLTYEAV